MEEDTEIKNEPEVIENASVSMVTTKETLDKFLDAADVSAVYGQPVQSGDTLIIPTAEVLSGVGFGLGYWGGQDAEGDSATGSGSGGGGRILSRPVAVVIASADEVRVEPVVDLTKIALAALTASGFMMGMLLRMMRGPRTSKDD